MINYRSIVTSLVFFSTPLYAKNITITQKSSGKSISVIYVKQSPDSITVKTSSGKIVTVPLSSLSNDTIEKIKSLAPSSVLPPTATSRELELFKKVNTAAGHPLFDKTNLWNETAATIAARLNWKRESIKERSSSYRLYTNIDYLFLGAHPYCVTLYGGEKDKPQRFSFVYANKGDFGSQLGVGPDHFRKIHPKSTPPTTLEEAIDADQEFIKKALTSALGKPKKQYYGERQDRRKVLRWDAAEQAFLLSALDDEYVHLLIVPTSDADLEGKVKFIKDTDLRKIQAANVRKKDNQDVLIENIPMVNQGPKGYCAPATFERAMRYMRVPADMYLLATSATTQEGTNATKLAEDCKNIVRSKARRIKELDLEKDLSIKLVKKFVNKGVPLLWGMRSLDSYNDIANTRSKQRLGIQDFKAWKTEIAVEAKSKARSLKTEANHHICMIIGYNEATQELAVSDSWGPHFELRWIHIDIAKAVTSRGGFVIDF